MRLSKIAFAVIFILLMLSTGCYHHRDPFVPGILSPGDLVGEWQGTYQNSIEGYGTIRVRFVMQYYDIRADYIIQDGMITGSSNVASNGREIVFIGNNNDLVQFQGDVNDSSTRINGTLILKYPLQGTVHGPATLTRL